MPRVAHRGPPKSMTHLSPPHLLVEPQTRAPKKRRAALVMLLVYLGAIAGFFATGLWPIGLGLCLGVWCIAVTICPPLYVPIFWLIEAAQAIGIKGFVVFLWIAATLINCYLLYLFGRHLDS